MRVCVCVCMEGLKQCLPSSQALKEPRWIDHMSTPRQKKKTLLHDCFVGPHTVNINLLKLRANLLKLVEAHVFRTSECEV